MNLYTIHYINLSYIFLIFKFIIRLFIKLTKYFILLFLNQFPGDTLYDKFLSRRVTMNFTGRHLIRRRTNREVRALRAMSYAIRPLVSQRASTINRRMAFREFREAFNNIYMSKRTDDGVFTRVCMQ